MTCRIKRCAREIPDDAIYCPYCGKPQKKGPQNPATRADGLMEQKFTINGQRISFYGKTPQEIQKKFLAYNMELEKGRQKSQQFSVVAESWQESHFPTLAHSSLRAYTRPLQRIIDYFGTRQIHEITPQDCQTFIGSLCSQGYSHKTVTTHRALLKAVFDHAIIGGYITSNPTLAIKLPKNLPRRVREPADEGVTQIIEASWEKPFGLLAYLVRYTGLRRGEALALQGKHFLFDRQLILVEHTLYWEGNQPRLKAPKTKAGYRLVPLVDAVAEKIKPLHLAPEDYLFPGPNGGPLTFSRQQDQWEKYLYSIGLATLDEKHTYHPSLELHQLRHNYASDLYDMGLDDKEIEEILGHVDARFTKDQYIKIRSDHLLNVAEKINTRFTSPALPYDKITTSNVQRT